MPEIFSLDVLGFRLLARQIIAFPIGKAGNVLRGALGTLLRKSEIRDPVARPSGISDPPHPYIIRAAHLDGKNIMPGESFGFDFHIFETRAGKEAFANSVIETATEMMKAGVGPTHGAAQVTEVNRETIRVDLAELEWAPARIAIEFRTPTELKDMGGIVNRPEFGVLFGRIRDRVSALRAFYGDGPVQVDFAGLGERAKAVELESCSLRHVGVMRRSSRTGQSHPIGGFVGEARYKGEFKEFLPWLRAAEWTGVGRQTVWGKGEIRVRSLE